MDVAELLGALPRVEAPANFNFGVNARIAQGRPSRRTLFPFLKVAVPLSLLLLVGGMVFFYGTMPGADQAIVRSDSPAVSSAPVTTREEPAMPSAASSVTNSNVVDPSRGSVVTASTQPSRKSAPRRDMGTVSTSDGGAGSYVGARTQPNVFQPPGTNTNKNPEVPVRTVLEMLGMKVDNAGGKWTVISTSASSVAERSGVLASDIIESINDQAIGGKDKLNGTVLGKALTVLRGGKSIKLDLKR
jgi:hypothetical protein